MKDKRIAFVSSERFSAVGSVDQPERGGRIEAILRSLEEARIPGVSTLSAETVGLAALGSVHDPKYVDWVVGLAQRGGGSLDADTYVDRTQLDLALLSVGASREAVRLVMSGEYEKSFAAVRPPGHHAGPTFGGGFCLFNNAALAARYAQSDLGAERVAIFDFDAHHGNGTQIVFEADPSVLYISTHQYPLYPGTGSIGEIGKGEGRGATINVPLPPGSGDDDLILAFDEIVRPATERFRPDLVIVSAGFDAHESDPLALLEVTTAGFFQLAHRLAALTDRLCRGRLALILEGGYSTEALADSVVATLRALASPISGGVAPSGNRPATRIGPTIAAIREEHKEYFLRS